LYHDVGQEFCISLDVALGGSGCEAVVEGFYSLVKAHTKAGGQSNAVLMERAVVDWTLPHPIACPETIDEITKMYIDGDKVAGLKPHRMVKFFDSQQRASSKYTVSKVIDRHQNETSWLALTFYNFDCDLWLRSERTLGYLHVIHVLFIF